MARSSGNSAGVVVAGLTAAALAVIGFFAFQAAAAQDRAEKPSASKSGSPSPDSPDAKKRATKKDSALPARSGSGFRVVYALERKRVWLIGKDGKVTDTFTVRPSTVSPAPGAYKVSSRASHVTGSDGVPIENVVRFTSVKGVSIGFSAALSDATPEAGASRKTGGIREKREDGEAMWLHATIGTRVVVVR